MTIVGDAKLKDGAHQLAIVLSRPGGEEIVSAEAMLWKRATGAAATPVDLGALKTLAVFVWATAFIRIGSAVLNTLSRHAGRVSFIQPRTLPLFERMVVDRFAFDVELFYIALKRNYDIKRLPVRLRCNETSTVNVLRDGAAMVRDLGAIRLNQLFGRYRPLLPVQRTIDSSPRANAAQGKVTLHDQ